MKNDLPKPKEGAIFYEDNNLYATLANNPITKGHVVIVWKDKVKDIHLLKREDYEYLMDKVDQVRDAMLEVLKIDKVYLIYMDETKHVHWHLVPRYNKKGIHALEGEPGKLSDISLAQKFKNKINLEL